MDHKFRLQLSSVLTLLVFLALTLAACSIAPAPQPIVGEPTPALDPIQVDHVELQSGVGSPIPAWVVVDANFPNTCAQIGRISQTMNGSEIDINLSAVTPTREGCVQDSLPFRAQIPLNVVGLGAGNYTVTVNGVSVQFKLPFEQVSEPSPIPESTGSINGWLWHDLCATGKDGEPPLTETPAGCINEDNPLGQYHANGILEPEEHPISGVRVRLGLGDCPATGLAEQVTIDTDLSYSFTGLAGGTYCVSIDTREEPNQTILLPGVWTFPQVAEGAIGQTVKLDPGEARFDVNFGWDYQFKP